MTGQTHAYQCRSCYSLEGDQHKLHMRTLYAKTPLSFNLLILQNRFTYAGHIIQRLINYDVS